MNTWKAVTLWIMMATCFSLGYFWPRTRYTFNIDTLTLCAENAWDGKACTQVGTGPWVPVLHDPYRKP